MLRPTLSSVQQWGMIGNERTRNPFWVCCMPDGVEVVPAADAHARLKSGRLAPQTYSVVLTDEGGRRLYVSVLSYLDTVPPAAACRHEQLLGAQATRALCLVSRLPCLATAEQVLRRLYMAVFCLGPSAPVADLLSALLRLPSPTPSRGTGAGGGGGSGSGSGGAGIAAKGDHDPWLPYVRAVAASGWGPAHDALVRRLFLRLFATLLQGYHEHLPPSAAAGGPTAGGGRQDTPQRASSSAPPFQSEALLQRHVASHGSRPLLAQLLQTQGFYVLVDEYGSQYGSQGQEPYGWYHRACAACRCELEELDVGIVPPRAPSTSSPSAADPDASGGIPGEAAAATAAPAAAAAAAAAEAPAAAAAEMASAAAAPEAPAAAAAAAGAAGAAGAGYAPAIIVIGAPTNDEDPPWPPAPAPAAAAAPAVPTWLHYTRPSLLLRRRAAPVYRTFPALNVSDELQEPHHGGGGGSDAAASSGAHTSWHGWQWHVMGPGGRRGASSGGGAAGGRAVVAAGGSGGGGGGEGPCPSNGGGMCSAVPLRKRRSGGRVNRSLSGSIRRRRHPPPPAFSPSHEPSAWEALAPLLSLLLRPLLLRPLLAVVVATGGSLGGPHSGGHRALAEYAVEQELVRAQMGGLAQLLSWGRPQRHAQHAQAEQHAQHAQQQEQAQAEQQPSGAEGAVPPGDAGALASGALAADAPEEAEVERVRQLLGLQASVPRKGGLAGGPVDLKPDPAVGGSGAFLVGRLREEVAALGADAAAAATSSPATPAPAPGPHAPVDCHVDRTAYDVLSYAFDALVTAAVQQGDFRVLGATLELAMSIHTHTGAGQVEGLGGWWMAKPAKARCAVAVEGEPKEGSPLPRSPAAAAASRATAEPVPAPTTSGEAEGEGVIVPAEEGCAGVEAPALAPEGEASTLGDGAAATAPASVCGVKADTDTRRGRSTTNDPDALTEEDSSSSAGAPGGAAAALGAARPVGGGAAAAAATAAAAAPPLEASCSVRSSYTGGGGGGGSIGIGRPYRVQYERGLAAAAAAAAGVGRLAQGQGQRAEQQRRGGARGAGGGSGHAQGPAASAELAVGGGRPIVALAAAAGVVLAAPQEPTCHVLSCRQDGCLRPAAKLPLGPLGGGCAELLALTPDGGTAAMSISPSAPPPARTPSAAAAASAATAAGWNGSSAASSRRGSGSGAGGGAAAAAAGAAQQRPGSSSGVVAVVDVATCRTIRELRAGPSGRITALQLSPTANLLVTGCAASWARLWDVRAGSSRAAPAASMRTRQAESGAPSILTGAGDGTVGVWSVDGRCRHMLPFHGGAVAAVMPYGIAAAGVPHGVAAGGGGGVWGGGGFVSCGADGSAALWAPPQAVSYVHTHMQYSHVAAPPALVSHSHTSSLACCTAWDAARGVLLRGDERGVVRAWVPGAASPSAAPV
ncbi:hypothetical protein TSOC_001846 [Tetrabaena socialis]|uniref:uDENN domain-containing protein n=1 Tax=Tetrabaena socialis TaxID=47790 RepID=A0A2J8AFL0_9CHLO|nr:hypothetical protein TSOC_001846 [Tetrabaena socialis]|eukprot:PNH11308.1 hypothetical protein TSOC_001846 [Tetrabaena socialis]